jgi:hypothetical protein
MIQVNSIDQVSSAICDNLGVCLGVVEECIIDLYGNEECSPSHSTFAYGITRDRNDIMVKDSAWAEVTTVGTKWGFPVYMKGATALQPQTSPPPFMVNLSTLSPMDFQLLNDAKNNSIGRKREGFAYVKGDTVAGHYTTLFLPDWYNLDTFYARGVATSKGTYQQYFNTYLFNGTKMIPTYVVLGETIPCSRVGEVHEYRIDKIGNTFRVTGSNWNGNPNLTLFYPTTDNVAVDNYLYDFVGVKLVDSRCKTG